MSAAWIGTVGIDGEAVLDASPDGVWVIDIHGRVTYATRACVEILGWPLDTLLGANVLDYVHPDDAALVVSSIDTISQSETGTLIELRIRTPDGEWRWIEIIGRNCIDDPAIRGIVCSGRDITRRRMWEVAGGDGTRMQQVLQHAPAIVMLLDRDGYVTGTNGAFTRLLGHDPSRVVGRPFATFGAGDDASKLLEAALLQVRDDGNASVEVLMSTTSGRAVPIRFELVDLIADPVVAGIAVTGHDVTELHAARHQLEHLATHDGLTGLPNRALLARRLGELLSQYRPLAVLYVDLDRFKPINDQLGHHAGDEVLRRVAHRLRSEVSPSDVVARVGGDEFVVLVVGVTDPDDAIALATRIRDAVEAPYSLPGGTVEVGASIGVALAGAGASGESLIREADSAMYMAKKA